MIGIKMIIVLSLIGRNSFHVKYIKLSYRIRGIVARTQMKNVAIIMVFITSVRSSIIEKWPVKKVTVNRLIIKMLAYSAMKMRANIPLLYSTLNPETSSDSPSAKSNGVRFVSAKLVINHITARGVIINIAQDKLVDEMMDISICLWITRADSKIRDILTS